MQQWKIEWSWMNQFLWWIGVMKLTTNDIWIAKKLKFFIPTRLVTQQKINTKKNNKNKDANQLIVRCLMWFNNSLKLLLYDTWSFRWIAPQMHYSFPLSRSITRGVKTSCKISLQRLENWAQDITTKKSFVENNWEEHARLSFQVLSLVSLSYHNLIYIATISSWILPWKSTFPVEQLTISSSLVN